MDQASLSTPTVPGPATVAGGDGAERQGRLPASRGRAQLADGGLPEELAAWIAAAPAVMGATRDAHLWDAGTRQRTLVALERVLDAVSVGRARVLTAEAEAGTWGLKGDRDLASFVGRVTRQGRGAGFAQVGQAATLAAMPAVAEAMIDGPVTATHVREITRATAASPSLAVELATPEGQARLVELAERFDGASFGKKIKALSAQLDPASRQREHDAQRARRFLTLTHRGDGTEIKGFVDTVVGYKVQKVIDAFNPRPAKGDTRPRDVRQADALAAIAEHIASDKRTTPGATAPVQALLTIDQETWTALRAARDAGEEAGEARDTAGKAGDMAGEAGDTAAKVPSRGSASDVVVALRGVAPVLDEDGRAWPASEVARALCDCVLTRAVVDAAGQPLDLGRDERLFQRANWLALLAAGQTTCAVAGCTMPLRYTELHHMAWWDRDGGLTDHANCAPECTYHHEEIHRLDIRVRRLPDGSYEHRYPDGRLYGGIPPGQAPPASALAQPAAAGADAPGVQAALWTA